MNGHLYWIVYNFLLPYLLYFLIYLSCSHFAIVLLSFLLFSILVAICSSLYYLKYDADFVNKRKINYVYGENMQRVGEMLYLIRKKTGKLKIEIQNIYHFWKKIFFLSSLIWRKGVQCEQQGNLCKTVWYFVDVWFTCWQGTEMGNVYL